MGDVSTTTDGPKNRRGTLRDEQKRATRAKLVDAARTLFEERGYAAVTVDDISSVVGCSRATFYVHFASKVEMLKTIDRQQQLQVGSASTGFESRECADADVGGLRQVGQGHVGLLAQRT